MIMSDLRKLDDNEIPVFPDSLGVDDIYLNEIYQVMTRTMDGPLGRILHLSIKRFDGRAIHDWRDLQWIKNQIAGPEAEAVELYPAESRLVDTSNQFHLWVLLDIERIPWGFGDRLVSDKIQDVDFGQVRTGRNSQRPFADHVRPNDLNVMSPQLQEEKRKMEDELRKMSMQPRSKARRPQTDS